MGSILDGLDDHEGLVERRLPDGQLVDEVWLPPEGTIVYVAGCGCGWRSQRLHAATDDGYDQAVGQWAREHAEPELARQGERRRGELGRVLGWLGDQAGQLQDPAVLLRVTHGLTRASGLAERLERDRAAPDREADRER
jgi:hypothetical protein